MPHGFRRDKVATAVLFANKLLLSRGSFLTLPTFADGKAHLHLAGEDRSLQRKRIWFRSKGKCAECRCAITEDSFEMDHKKGGLVGRCDCLHNLQALCHDCHVKKHGREPRWTPRLEREVQQDPEKSAG